MVSETRANLIFLGIFLVLMGPGLGILATKAYRRGAAGINPPAPKTVVAYNDPNPQNPALPRVVPPQTAGLVDSIAYRLGNLQPELKRVTSTDGTPVLSNKRLLECLSVGSDAQHQYVALIGWDRTFAPLPSLYQFTARQNGQMVDLKMSAYEQVNMPLEVRDELQKYGYILPPDSFMWIILESPNAQRLEEIQLHYVMDKRTVDDRLVLPPEPVSAPRSDDLPHP